MVKNGHCEERSEEAISLTMRLLLRAGELIAMTDNTRFNVARQPEQGSLLIKLLKFNAGRSKMVENFAGVGK